MPPLGADLRLARLALARYEAALQPARSGLNNDCRRGHLLFWPMGIFEELMRTTDDPDAVEAVQSQVVALVVPGFYERAEVVESAIEYAEDDGVLTDEQVTQLVDEVWLQRLLEQQTWAEVTDADRFAAAFAELEAAGVVARMNFTCCQGCGASEIFDERPADRQTSAYTFFHQQDAEQLADNPAVVYLAYGAFDADETTWETRAVEVGHQIAATLRTHDLPVTWSGTTAQRIQVGPLNWQRRLPA